jgi:formylglycine-generating enzyme required for sulfatase activity
MKTPFPLLLLFWLPGLTAFSQINPPPARVLPDSTDILDNMVFLPGGTFQMGVEDLSDYERPVHAVTLSSFYISKYELTVAEFQLFIEASGYQTEAEQGGGSFVLSGDRWDIKAGANWRCDVAGNPRPASEYNHPVIHVSWNDAVAYCRWKSQTTGRNYRLPTEAEWEFAAGGGNPGIRSSIWAGTSEEGQLRSFVNIKGVEGADTYTFTAPVGSFKPNASGLYDMSGNVMEWCSDQFDRYTQSPETNPTGATRGNDFVLRGGYWANDSLHCRVAYRNSFVSDVRMNYIGFRVVCQ